MATTRVSIRRGRLGEESRSERVRADMGGAGGGDAGGLVLLAEKMAEKGVTSTGVKYEEVADMGLVALFGSSTCEDAKGDLGITESRTSSNPKLTLGRLLLERMGRSLRFFLTFFLSWWSSARSLERSSGRRSSLDEGTLREAAPASSESEVSESVNCRVSSKVDGSLSKRRTGST